jgi:RHH-type proline utilization regulon transcriptional repressor/proline dehydrogenase/delta 1-pyrroline-5-carboxylate dehydrogenase
MIFEEPLPEAGPLREALRAALSPDETEVVQSLVEEAALPEDARGRVAAQASALVAAVRAERLGRGGLDAFLHEYGLSSKEGVVLMCLAEAMLRVPDAETIDKLIKDKLAAADWEAHLGHSDSLFVNASTWALMLTGRVVRLDDRDTRDFTGILRRLIHGSGEPVIRNAMLQAMRILGRQFVMGRTIGEALERAQPDEAKGYRYSYDMLGEAARTMADAERYFESYSAAIAAIGAAGAGKGEVEGPGISVKLSALHPRYEFAQRGRMLEELAPRVAALAEAARDAGIGFTIDAEESDRLELSLDVVEAVSGAPELAGWDGLGVAVQAYLKRGPALIDWLADLARRHRRRLMVRLVKGAYWDAEIKRAQEQGLEGYPVFTRKASTDVCYLACIRRLLSDTGAFYPQFATHNAHSVAVVLELAGASRDFEFQRLHGMGEALYEQVVEEGPRAPCRIYAPVGSHEDLLAYLVRRLLENGANSSFVNRIVDEKLPIGEIIADPVEHTRGLMPVPHPRIPLPADLYGAARRNSAGIDLTDPRALAPLAEVMEQAATGDWQAGPIVAGEERASADPREVRDPADRRRLVGHFAQASAGDVEDALAKATAAAASWNATSADERGACLERMADLMEAECATLMALCVREAGKTLADAIAEVREAVDFCRYYAVRARAEAAGGGREGRGVFVCISPWNFPLAIFTGQVAAALAAGNAVIAKPAEQTPLIAAQAVRLLHRAGVPPEVLHLLPGDGARVGGALVGDARTGGVCFTGSTEVAQIINRGLAARPGPIAPLIAETGGQNAMIADSTALPEQVVADVLTSAFQSAGQRCSALRVLFVQEDVAGRMLEMLAGAMEELSLGDPGLLSTDVGPVIDEEARGILEAHVARMARAADLVHRTPLGAGCEQGTFVAPAAFEISGISVLEREVFGPVLHVVRFAADRLDQVIDAINATGYGLTFGIHSRIDATVEHVYRRLRVGNTYVNRNQIGAVVGVQPFGGQGLSGTGPKAGGPHYLPRFMRLPAAEEVVPSTTRPSAGPASARLAPALAAARRAQPEWAATPGGERAACLEKAAGLMAARGGAELEAAAAVLRDLVAAGRAEVAEDRVMPGPTGERNELALRGRGLFLCLATADAPPSAVVAQAAAALLAGNAVVAVTSGAEAAIALGLLPRAAVPAEVLQVLSAEEVPDVSAVVREAEIDGVAFAGPASEALALNRALAEREGAILPLIVSGEEANYGLARFAVERTLSIDTTASGGNATLMSLEDEEAA